MKGRQMQICFKNLNLQIQINCKATDNKTRGDHAEVHKNGL